MSILDKQKILDRHKRTQGKIKIIPKVRLKDKEDLTEYYSPGVALPCLEIKNDHSLIKEYTNVSNLVAVITDGSAVLGLGNIGPKAAMPVMEGKCLLFSRFGQVQAIPICLDTQDTEEIIRTIQNIAPSFGGINLEDISAPRCVEIERRLKESLSIPVFHDDQHGTRIAVMAGIINVCRLYNLDITKLKVVLCGIGAAGSSIARGLKRLGVRTIYGYNKEGIITKSKYHIYDEVVKELIDGSILTQYENDCPNTLGSLLVGADIFIGVSAANLITAADISQMKRKIIFALANPNPELSIEEAEIVQCDIYATGRSDLPNQINNCLVFPGLFKGVLKYGINQIDEELMDIVAHTIAYTINPTELTRTNIIPNCFDKTVVNRIVKAIAKYAREENTK